MVINIYTCILLFFLYSFLGWVMEVTLKYIELKRFINRGFLIGPYCPIYGCGAVLITLLLQKFVNDPITLFVYGIIICSILEYTTSFIMEKLFNARWWDYSTKKFNINGRICLETMIPFGLLGLAIVYIINPFFLKIFDKISPKTITFISISLIVIFIIDLIISLFALLAVRNEGKLLEKDNTEEMSKRIKDLLSKKNWIEKRLTSAFPNAKHVGIKFKKTISAASGIIKDKGTKIRLKKEETLQLLQEEYNKKKDLIKKKFEKSIKKQKNKSK